MPTSYRGRKRHSHINSTQFIAGMAMIVLQAIFTSAIRAKFAYAEYVRMPAHARVNNRCYPVWDAGMKNLNVVWDGKEYNTTLRVSSVPTANKEDCKSDSCVERLWCTDSGVVGLYTARPESDVLSFEATWLLNTTVRYQKYLGNTDIFERDGQLHQQSTYGPGTVVVVGNTLYYYSHYPAGGDTRVLPLLSSLIFSEYRVGATASKLVTTGLRYYSMMSHGHPFRWNPYFSPIYPSGPGALTISIACADHYLTDWAVDVVVNTVGSGSHGAEVLYQNTWADMSSASRSSVTFPGYTCSAMSKNRHQCAIIGTGRYAWGRGRRLRMGRVYHYIQKVFFLPNSIWLMNALGICTRNHALATFGHVPEIAVNGDKLVAMETVKARSCASGRLVVQVTRSIENLKVLNWTSLCCEYRQISPAANSHEPAYGALAIKWIGPWADGQLFVAVDLEHSVYYKQGTYAGPFAGDPSNEHVAYSHEMGVITLRVENDTLDCTVMDTEGPPTNASIAAGAAAAGEVPCLREMLKRGVSPNAVHKLCPLIAWAGSPEVVRVLLDAGADPSSWCENVVTSLNNAVWKQNVIYNWSEEQLATVKAILSAGAAVCTWPRNPFNSYRGRNDAKALAIVAKVAHKSPCSPGFYLQGQTCFSLTICPPGNFCPGHFQATNKFFPCPAGTYGPMDGAMSITQCRPCPLERPLSAPGSSDMSECMQGPTSTQDVSAPTSKHSVDRLS